MTNSEWLTFQVGLSTILTVVNQSVRDIDCTFCLFDILKIKGIDPPKIANNSHCFEVGSYKQCILTWLGQEKN